MDTEEKFVESEEEEITGEEGGLEGEETVFAVGNVVFPLEKEQDVCDPEAVLINPADSYVGKYMGEFLSKQMIGASDQDMVEEEEEDEIMGRSRSSRKHWKVLGTMVNKRATPPNFLWATMKTDDYDAYIKEVLKCGYIIYDMTSDQSVERCNEVRAICDALREKVSTFRTKRVFILISSLHSWSHTKLTHVGSESSFSEANYRHRRTKPAYRDLQLLERYVVASGKMTKGMLKAYVIGAGAVYGGEEGPLHQWFKAAWHNAKYLPIYGSGKNFMPTTFIKDLASIVQHMMDMTPMMQRYIIAVDPVIPQQEQVVKAIAGTLGTSNIERLPAEDIYENKALTTYQADQLMLNLKIEPKFCQENFNIDWLAEEGFASVVEKIADEYRKTRNLKAFKVIIVGPPGAGKSTVCKELAEMYRFHHFTKNDMIDSTRQLLRETAGGEVEKDIAGVDTKSEEEAREKARQLLDEIDTSELQNNGVLPEDIVIKIFRYRLLTNPCQNQGFILDDYPENYYQAKALFMAEESSYDEELGEDGKDILDTRLAPDKVFIFEAPDWFLKKRITSIPVHELEEKHQDKQFAQSLQAYRDKAKDYDSSFEAYLDEQEIIYYPIDISTDTSKKNQSTVNYIAGMLGKPRNYGISREEEEALREAQFSQVAEMEKREKEDLALLEGHELEERRKNIQRWMEKLSKIKKEEFEREEAALLPLRHYLMQHIVPTLTKGLIDVTRARPEDPIDFLAEYLFQNNPGGLTSNDQYIRK